jgi:hypothetical protein
VSYLLPTPAQLAQQKANSALLAAKEASNAAARAVALTNAPKGGRRSRHKARKNKRRNTIK